MSELTDQGPADLDLQQEDLDRRLDGHELGSGDFGLGSGDRGLVSGDLGPGGHDSKHTDYARELADYFLTVADKPIVLRHLTDGWPASDWTPQSLADELSQRSIRFRIGHKSLTDIEWETNSKYEDATIQDFLDWLHGNCCHDNPLASYNRDLYWCYADYKYMVEIFGDKPHMLKAVEWERLGFPGRSGRDSTWWLGSEGAYTVCHYDTYGSNLVAQIYGRKRWTLFAPEDTPALYPTRIPYEESSVFSQVNIRSPDLANHPKYNMAAPYRVTLEPGDVLFVPRHWWHFVESLEPSISINTWIELECDAEARLEEAVTRLLTCSLMGSNSGGAENSLHNWLNPTEVSTPFSQNLTYIKQASAQMCEAGHFSSCLLGSQTLYGEPDHCVTCSRHKMDNNEESSSEPSSKVQKLCQSEPGADGQNTSENSKKTIGTVLGVKADVSVSTTTSAPFVRPIVKHPIVSEDFELRHVIQLAPVTVHKKVCVTECLPAGSTYSGPVMKRPRINRDNSLNTGSLSCGESRTIVELTKEPSDKDIMNCVLNPNVVKVICKNLKELLQIKH